MASNWCVAKGWVIAGLVLAWATSAAWATDVTMDTSAAGRRQTIDGFGAHQGSAETSQAWWQNLFFTDMQCSIYRVDLTPTFKSPYSDHVYNSPWFGNTPSLPGPDNNNVRTYTNATDYTRTFAGQNAQIAVMGPNIDVNTQAFTFASNNDGLVAQMGQARAAQLGDFKLIGSLWSPAPWVKISSGNTYPSGSSSPYPTAGTPWPFVWGGNFAGGKLDVSDTPLPVFDDSALGGTGPTSALTQYARCTAAFLRAYQNQYGVHFYAISIQNELNFEEFYNSCTFPLSSQYLAALKHVRAELDKYPDLAPIKIMGPEDLMGGDVWGMWQYGGGATTTHKNLQYLSNLALDSTAMAALSYFCIHGYAANGTSSAGSNPTQWDWWANGWTTPPASGIPANIHGFAYFNRKSWMTETSGEDMPWLSPSSGFPNNGGWSIALKMHQALTVGRQSAWLYWTFAQTGTNDAYELTGSTPLATAPKYIAAKHFFRYIRPNSQAVAVTVTGSTTMLASAYVNDTSHTLTIVLVNSAATADSAVLHLPAWPAGIASLDTHTSSNGALWQPSATAVASGMATVSVPGYGVTTLYGVGVNQAPAQPVNVAPADGTAGVALPVTLTASPFSDPDPGDTQSASQWQVRTSANPTDWSAPAYDSGTTSALTSAVVRAGSLPYGIACAWHVRYRDNHGAWSAWSADTTFSTIAPANHPPATPVNTAPATAATNVALPLTLVGSPFSDPDAGDTQIGAQWQVRAAASPTSYTVTAFDSGTTTALTSARVRTGSLAPGAPYAWRVRYEDNHGAWSAWSAETAFSTAPAAPVNHPPAAPANTSPPAAATNVAMPVTLVATAFSDPDAGDTQAAAQWQMRTLASPANYSLIAYDSGTTTALTACMVPASRLWAATSYGWRVRYQDNHNAWSAWSVETSFTTQVGLFAPAAVPNAIWMRE